MHFITAPVARQKNTPYDLMGSLRIIAAKHSFGGACRLLHSSCQVSMVMMFIVSAEQALIHSVQPRLQSPPPSCLLATGSSGFHAKSVPWNEIKSFCILHPPERSGTCRHNANGDASRVLGWTK